MAEWAVRQFGSARRPPAKCRRTPPPLTAQRTAMGTSKITLNYQVLLIYFVRNVRRINKFTEGLDFASMVDWASEIRPSMRKLRQAMDGLLKTARLTHSVLRVQQDSRSAMKACSIQYRRDICFSQAVRISLVWILNCLRNLLDWTPLKYFLILNCLKDFSRWDPVKRILNL